MSNRLVAGRKSIWGVIVIALLAAPPGLRSQDISLVNASAHQPFTGLDEALSRVADKVLASETPTIRSTIIVQTDTDKWAGSNQVVNGESRSGITVVSNESAAAKRLSLLRPIVEPILRSHGIPEGLTAVILVESGGRREALSPKGARGLWQLMPETARRYGLRIDEFRDDRLDLSMATNAAAEYLHDLYAQFGDWKLALAAYNTGEANVGSAISRAHTQDFDQLANLRMLPLETRNYVPRVLAAGQFIELAPNFMGEPDATKSETVFAMTEPVGSDK
jgi:hypothetical protein